MSNIGFSCTQLELWQCSLSGAGNVVSYTMYCSPLQSLPVQPQISLICKPDSFSVRVTQEHAKTQYLPAKCLHGDQLSIRQLLISAKPNLCRSSSSFLQVIMFRMTSLWFIFSKSKRFNVSPVSLSSKPLKTHQRPAWKALCTSVKKAWSMSKAPYSISVALPHQKQLNKQTSRIVLETSVKV